MRVTPNGVMAFSHEPPDRRARLAAKKDLELAPDGLAAIFIGSPYGPNLDAARFIANELSAAMPGVTFVIAGGVGEAITAKSYNFV